MILKKIKESFFLSITILFFNIIIFFSIYSFYRKNKTNKFYFRINNKKNTPNLLKLNNTLNKNSNDKKNLSIHLNNDNKLNPIQTEIIFNNYFNTKIKSKELNIKINKSPENNKNILVKKIKNIKLKNKISITKKIQKPILIEKTKIVTQNTKKDIALPKIEIKKNEILQIIPTIQKSLEERKEIIDYTQSTESENFIETESTNKNEEETILNNNYQLEYADRILKHINLFPGKKKHTKIIYSKNIENKIIIEFETPVPLAYKMHIIKTLKNIEIPKELINKTIITTL